MGKPGETVGLVERMQIDVACLERSASPVMQAIAKDIREAADAITALIAERDALAKDLVHADHALMVVQLAIEEDTTALNDCLWIPDRFGPNESVFDFVGNARSTLNLTVNHDG